MSFHISGEVLTGVIALGSLAFAVLWAVLFAALYPLGRRDAMRDREDDA